jgi:hypothetical protein
MVDFGIQGGRCHEWPPSNEDGMGHLQHTNVCLGVGGGETADKVLFTTPSVHVRSIELALEDSYLG